MTGGRKGSSRASLQQCRYGLPSPQGQASYCWAYTQSAIAMIDNIPILNAALRVSSTLRYEEWRLLVSVTCSAYSRHPTSHLIRSTTPAVKPTPQPPPTFLFTPPTPNILSRPQPPPPAPHPP